MENTTVPSVEEFDLDITVIEKTATAQLMRDTSDNCGHTCGTACVSCRR